MNKTLFFNFLIFCFPIYIFAQINFRAESNTSEVAVGERFKVEYNLTVKNESLRNLDESISLPSFENFEVLNQGMSESSNYINGDFSREISYQLILRATKPGNHKIKPATIKLGGKTYKTNTLQIKVSGKEIPNPSQPNRRNQQTEKPNRDTFVLFETDKSNPYFNESIIGSLNLYTKNYEILNRVTSVQPPNFNGVTTIPIESRQRVEQVEKFGDVFIRATLQEYVMYPVRSGSIDLPSFSVGVLVGDGFFNEEETQIYSEPTQLFVKNLPANKPKNFSGAVGNFTMNVNIDNHHLETNSTTNVEVEIIGNGNFKLLKTPKIEVPEEVETYTPKLRENYQATSEGLKGKLVSNTTIVPNYGGKFEIKIEPFSFFNPEKNTYETLNPKPILLTVNGDKKPIDDVANQTMEDKQEDATDFTFSPVEKMEELIENPKNKNNLVWFGIPTLLILSSLGGFVWYKKQKENLNVDKNVNVSESIIQSKKIEIHRETSDENINLNIPNEINKLNRYVEQNNKQSYFSELEKLLKQIASPSSTLSMNEMETEIVKKYGENYYNNWKELLLKCQIEKYSPLNDSSLLGEVHRKVVNSL